MISGEDPKQLPPTKHGKIQDMLIEFLELPRAMALLVQTGDLPAGGGPHGAVPEEAAKVCPGGWDPASHPPHLPALGDLKQGGDTQMVRTINTARKKDMTDQQDLRSSSGWHAALLLHLAQHMDHPACSEINSAAFLLQEWLGAPTRFIFPMAGGRTASHDLQDLLLGTMVTNMVVEHPARRLASPVKPGHHSNTVLLRNEDLLEQYRSRIAFVLKMTEEIPESERHDLSALIWLISRKPGIGRRNLLRDHSKLWNAMPGYPFPYDRTQTSVLHLQKFTGIARANGLEPLVIMPDHPEDIPAGPPSCRTHREAYNLETSGKRFHIVQNEAGLMACWENEREMTPVRIELPGSRPDHWEMGCPLSDS